MKIQGTFGSNYFFPLIRAEYNEAIVYIRLCPRWETHDQNLLVFVVGQNNRLESRLLCYRVLFYGHLKIHTTRYRAITWKHDVVHKTGSRPRIAVPPERTEPRPQATCTKKIWWSSAVWFLSYASKQTDKQTEAIILGQTNKQTNR